MATQRKIPATHPGDILRIEFLEPLGMSQSELARQLKVDKRRVNDVVKGRRAVTASTAVRLAAFFGTTAGFWMNMQKRYELDMAREEQEEAQREIQPFEMG
jgi:addiction module HigA family antidote